MIDAKGRTRHVWQGAFGNGHRAYCPGDGAGSANIMKQDANLHDLELATALPGGKVNTSPTNYHPIRQMQLVRWNGKTWERFGELIEGSGT